MPLKGINKNGLINKIKTLAAPPTPDGRLKNAGVDFLLSVLAFQVANQFTHFASDTLTKVEPILNRASSILYSGQTISPQQIETVGALQHNVKLMLGQVETAHVASWSLLGLTVLATVQLLYNGVQAGIQTVKNIKDN